MEDVELEVANSNYPQRQNDMFNLILKEKNGSRFVPIMIGIEEAKSIILELNHIRIKRPFAHDLFVELCRETGSEVCGVRIADCRDGIFYVNIDVRTPAGAVLLDSRVSDAVVIALKCGVPIRMEHGVFARTCYTMSESNENGAASPDPAEISLHNLPLGKLEKMLDEAVRSENYERAAEIDEEIKKRNANG